MSYDPGVAPTDGTGIVDTTFRIPALHPTSNQPYFITVAQLLNLGSGSGATAPSQVGSLTPGTPTATTIPLTWTAATGTSPLAYATKTALHGSSTFTSASGTFGATGGTITGLTASTNYDIQVIVTNSAGSSITSLLTGITTAAASGTAPSQVGSLAAGTPTSTTIPATYTAATGTPTITYGGFTSPHGANTWTANGGTFTATGGTFTGLSASTNYDLRISAMNGSGTTNTDLTTGVTTAAASTYPSMTFTTSPTFVTTGQKFGSGALSGGAGTASKVTGVTGGAGGNYCDLTHDFFIYGTGAFTGTGALFASIVNNGVTMGWGWGSDGNLHGYVNGTSAGSITGANVRNGAYHYLLIVPTSNAGGGPGNTDVYFFLDGSQQFNTTLSGTAILKTSATTIGVDFTQLKSGDLIDDMRLQATWNQDASVPSAAQTRDANTAILLPFDGNGNGI